MIARLYTLPAAIFVATGFALTTLPTTALAKKPAVSSEEVVLNVPFFTDKEKELIEDFFDILQGRTEQSSKDKSKKKKGLPPGLAKKKELPPGLAKQLEKKGTLPPGLAKRDLPRDLESRLPGRKSIFERIIVGDDILLIERGTQIILDILRGAVGK